MAVIPEFISVLRKIRDVIYPQVNELYEDSLILKEQINVGKIEFDQDYEQFNADYAQFNIKKDQIDASVTSASSSALSASQSAQTATNKSNEIKAITAQSTTGAPGTNASASYNPTDGKFTFVIPQGTKGDKGESFTVNSSGVTASRTLYDAQPTGWSFLDITTSTLYFKASNTSGDWSSGVPFGKGDKGDQGDTGVGITSFTFISTTDVSGLPAKSGATDTYRVTLTDLNTFDYEIYNGLDADENAFIPRVTSTIYRLLEFSSTNGDVKDSNLYSNADGNLGLGVTPSIWHASVRAFETKAGSLFNWLSTRLSLMQNAYHGLGDVIKYKTTGKASMITQEAGEIKFYTAPNGTAETTANFTERAKIDNDGNLILGGAKVIDSGLNASGTYTKFADGTMEAETEWSANNTTSSGTSPINIAVVSLNFPIEFTRVDIVSVTAERVSGGTLWAGSLTAGGVTLNGASAYLIGSTATSVGKLKFKVKGKWK